MYKLYQMLTVYSQQKQGKKKDLMGLEMRAEK